MKEDCLKGGRGCYIQGEPSILSLWIKPTLSNDVRLIFGGGGEPMLKQRLTGGTRRPAGL
jgi:hypothetical protein